MKLIDALELKRNLNNLQCRDEDSMYNLDSFADQLKTVMTYIEENKPADVLSFQGSIMQFSDSKLSLESWLKRRKKSTMHSTFREYKADFLSILNDFIKFGKAHNLWEN